MAIFKCKMCGGELNVSEGMTVCECEYCGTKQTLPKLDDEKKITLYERASHFRRNNEFDKAAGFYETILAEDKTDAEAYWSLVLCRYGIEYVEDPSTHKRIPTVNRAQYTSVLIDEDYQSAMKYADGYQRDVYEAEAKSIDEIQKGILEISSKEEPFDVFICYKETNSDGSRTKDSVYAQKIYDALTKEDYRVFFSRITLEDKLGTAYEPYIFAALNSSKVMITVGTSRSNLNSVWVKNEWSRYLALIKAGEEKHIIPVYCDMDAYDLPDEFSYLQSQDRNKVGFMQDLVRGVKKLISQDVIDTRQKSGTTSVIVDTMMNRATTALAKKEWETAIRCFDSVLDYDDKNANAYLGKLMATHKINEQEKLADIETPLENDDNYLKSVEFADDSLKEKLIEYNLKTIENADNIAKKKKNKNKKRFAIIISSIIVVTLSIAGYFLNEFYIQPLGIYNSAIKLRNEKDYDGAIEIFKSIDDFKDSEYQINNTYYMMALDVLNEEKYQQVYFVSTNIKSNTKNISETNKLLQDLALKLLDAKSFEYAARIAIKIEDNGIKYDLALAIYDKKDYANALIVFNNIDEAFKDRDKYLKECENHKQNEDLESKYKEGCNFLNQGNYDKAVSRFKEISDYKDSKAKLLEVEYQYCKSFIDGDGDLNYVDSELFDNSLNDIVNNDYKDAKQLYNKHYTPTADIIFNTSGIDGITNNSTVPNNFIIHINITDWSGTANSYKVVVVHPNGETDSINIDDISESINCQSNSGELTVKVYDKNGTLIGSKSVTVI